MTAPVDLRYFAGRIEKLSKRLDQVPRMSWATVVTTAPLTIHVDGDPAPLIGAVKNAGPKILLPGTRVQVMRQDLRYTVISASIDLPSRGTSAQRVELGLSGVLEDGHRFYDTVENREYVWASGVWRVYEMPPQDLPLRTAGVVGEYSVSGGLVEIWWDASSKSLPVGFNDIASSGAIPAGLRPSRNRFGTAYLAQYAAVSYVAADGAVRVVNQTGASRGGGSGTILYRI